MDTIRFELRAHQEWTDDERLIEYEVVDVVINGRRLDQLWSSAQDLREAFPLDLREVFQRGGCLWSAQPPSNEVLVLDDGRVAVLTCGCGFFGCGGAAARIRFTSDAVMWDQFRYGNDMDDERFGDVPLGPFEFDRQQYDAELESVRPHES